MLQNFLLSCFEFRICEQSSNFFDSLLILVNLQHMFSRNVFAILFRAMQIVRCIKFLFVTNKNKNPLCYLWLVYEFSFFS